jgi:O-antigen ligase
VLFTGLFIFEEDKIGRWIYGITLTAAGGAVIAANSDVTYAGCGTGLLILFLIATYYGRIERYLLSAILICSGYGLVSVITGITGRGAYKLSGISGLATYPVVVLIVLVLLVSLFCICRFMSKIKAGRLKADNKNKTIAAAVIIAVIMLAVIIIGIINRWSIFIFDDYWGNYRGFVWDRLCKIYKDFPMVKKIFGYGNETIRALMTDNYYEEMFDLTATVYDSAHNEYLQYLVTTGLFGLVSYVGLCVATIVNGVKLSGELRKSKERNISNQLRVPEISVTYMLPLIMVAAYTAYLIQAVFNVIQPITTPYAFLLAAMLAGMRRTREK